MEVNIYKEMIDDSPIPYVCIKLFANDEDDYTSLTVLDYNKAYEKSFELTKDKNYIYLIKTPISREDKESWNNTFKKAKENKKYTVERYVENIKELLNITIFYIKDNKFYLRLSKINKQNIALSSAIKSSPFSAWIKDTDGRYVDVNQIFLDDIYLKLEDVIGKTNFDLLSKSDAEFIKYYDDEVIKNSKMYKFEYKKINRDREDQYFEVVQWPYMNSDETVILGIISIAKDVSETVKLRKQLEETEKRFLEIANNINDIIIIRDEKKAEYINPAFEKVYGFKPDALYEDINAWYEHWDSVEFDSEITSSTFKEVFECKFKASKKGQEDKWIWSRFVPILDEQGNTIKKIGILTDITESKKAEEELDAIKMEFLANLSHELRTPINLILTSLQVLYLKMNNLDSDTFEYFDKYLNILGQNGQRLLKLVNNLIDTTKLDAGCFNYHPSNHDIVSFVEDLCMSITSFVNINDLDIIFDTDEEEKIISFDPDNMERIILNLLSNAIKFNKPNGKIEVTIFCNDNVQISVKDTGIGIPKEKFDSIFGRFEQVKTKFKKEREGSGIGLSLVKSIVEMHNGTVTLNSTQGEGSEFIITLPDVLTYNENTDVIKVNKYDSNLNTMKIELSDIYT